MPECHFNRTLQKSRRHRVFSDIAYTHPIKEGVVVRLESHAVQHEELDDGKHDGEQTFVSQQESRYDICGPDEF